MAVADIIREVQIAAEADSAGDPIGHARLLEGIYQLNLLVETPKDTIMRVLFQPHQSAALRLAVEMGLPLAIAKRNGERATAVELSKITGADTLLIARVMRVLTAMGMCKEDGEDLYSANPVTLALASPGFSGGVRCIYDPFVPTAATLIEYMHQSGFQSPRGLGKGPMEYALQLPHWEYLRENPVLRESMDAYMAVRGRSKTRWFDIFPIESCLGGKTCGNPDSVLLVDIGGSQGHDIKTFKEWHPHLQGRLILQDLPEAIDKIKAPLVGIETMSYDFFTLQPVKGARAYFFHAVCHDWSDQCCQKFLSNTAHAMDKGYSKLLIYEFVLPNMGTSIQQATLDIHMMATVSGMERTEEQWRQLLDSTGLQIVQIWRASPLSEAVIEAKLKD